MRIISIILSITLLLICSCYSERDPCGHRADINIDPPYEASEAVTDFEARVNFIVDDVISCLHKEFPDGIHLYTREDAWCDHRLGGEIRSELRKDLTVHVIECDRRSADGTQMMLDREAPCTKDWQDKSKPCYWRSGIQEDCVVVTCHDLHMLPEPLVRFFTSCTLTDKDPRLSHCARPRTEPLTGKWRFSL